MVALGLALSSEEHGPRRLVDLAIAAEDAGFDFVSISDHYHPWLRDQGHSPFVWSVLGAIAASTRRLTVGTGEHILADRWPPAEIRQEMLDEAIASIRDLWTGASITHYGRYYTVEDARIFDAPEQAPPIVVSAFGPSAAKLAARSGDGLWMSTPDPDVAKQFFGEGGTGPVFGQISCCYDDDVATASKIAHQYWRTAGVPGQLSQDLPTVAHFEMASSNIAVDKMPDFMPCGPDLDPIVEKARDAIETGVDHLYFHQIGPRQDEFLRVWQDELGERIAAVAA